MRISVSVFLLLSMCKAYRHAAELMQASLQSSATWQMENESTQEKNAKGSVQAALPFCEAKPEVLTECAKENWAAWVQKATQNDSGDGSYDFEAALKEWVRKLRAEMQPGDRKSGENGRAKCEANADGLYEVWRANRSSGELWQKALRKMHGCFMLIKRQAESRMESRASVDMAKECNDLADQIERDQREGFTEKGLTDGEPERMWNGIKAKLKGWAKKASCWNRARWNLNLVMKNYELSKTRNTKNGVVATYFLRGENSNGRWNATLFHRFGPEDAPDSPEDAEDAGDACDADKAAA